MKRILARVMLPMAVVAGVGMLGAGEAQSQPSCEFDMVCLYDGVGYGGQSWLYNADTSYVGDDVNDRASSVYNATGSGVALYSDRDFAGTAICLAPDSGIDDLGAAGLNDAISSLAFGC